MGGGGEAFGVGAGLGQPNPQQAQYGNDLSRLFSWGNPIAASNQPVFGNQMAAANQPIAGTPIAYSNNQPAKQQQQVAEEMYPLLKKAGGGYFSSGSYKVF